MDEAPAEVVKEAQPDGGSPPVPVPGSETAGTAGTPEVPAAFPPPRAAPPDIARGPVPSPAPTAAPRRRGVRWMDTAITLLLAGSVAGVLLVAMPPILRASGLVSAPPRPIQIPLRQPPRNPPSFFHEDSEADDDDSTDDLMRPPSLPGWRHGGDPLNPGSAPDLPRLPHEAASGEPSPGKSSVRIGLARHRLKLRERPGEGTDVTGAVQAGEVVMIMKDVGEWVLIMHSGDDDVSMGWTKRSDIAIR